jgi:hypothetical protein
MLNHLPSSLYRLDVQATNAEGKTTTVADFTIMEAESLERNNGGTQQKKEVMLPSIPNSFDFIGREASHLGVFSLGFTFFSRLGGAGSSLSAGSLPARTWGSAA